MLAGLAARPADRDGLVKSTESDFVWACRKVQILPVRSNLNGTVWYLNGKRAVMNKENIVIPQGGFHRITAVHNECRSSVMIEIH